MDAEVVIAGAGPVGLLLAAELRSQGAEAVVIEALSEPLPFSKAFGLSARTVESMELRGLVEPLAAEAARATTFIGGPHAGGAPPASIPLAHFAGIRTLRLDRLDTDHPGLLPIAQTGTEAVLAAHAIAAGASVRRGVAVTGLRQDEDGVTVETSAGPLRARYLVGCDGGRSTVRRLAGFGFDGTDPTITGRLAEVAVPELLDRPGMGWHRLPGGIVQVLPGRVLTVEFDGPPVDRDSTATAEEIAASISRVVGRAVELPTAPTWLTRFTDNTRLADTYRRGRVLLAGDAAHVHSPFGGQGLNLGLQDAMNLGWKLAAHVRGRASEGLLDSYEAERRPVAARVLHNTRAQVALMNPDPRVTPLRELFTELMALDQVNRHLAAMASSLDVRYELPGAHPLTGRFVPPLAVATAAGRHDVRALLRGGRAVLVDLLEGAGLREAAAPWHGRVEIVSGTVVDDAPADAAARANDAGPVALAGGLLVRPDGYVAWAGDEAGELRAALAAWCGTPDGEHAAAAASTSGY